ncbi:MAG: Crp/Fnr family transcriptional regulator [Curvibacter sp.]|nr:Crp/Fnr family transcriptional regulator [Curvibacter sp.]
MVELSAGATDPLARLQAFYPALGALPAAQRAELPALLGPGLELPAGQLLFAEQQDCPGFPLLLSGEVQVTRRSPDGRQLELYRLVPGEICLMSSASLFRGQPLAACARTTRETQLCVLAPAVFQSWLALPGFRAEVLGLYAERMVELMGLIDAIAFQRLDQRLAAALLGHGPSLHLTHQTLADQLGTVREIVTRLLRRFEREGWVALSRECIAIRDSAALRRLADPG